MANVQNAKACGNLGCGKRVPIVAMIQRPHKAHHIPGALAEIDPPHGCRTVGAPIDRAARQILWLRAQTAFHLGHHSRKTVNRSLIAACVQGQRGIIRRNLEQLLLHDIARVHPLSHQVPSDAVLHLAVQKRPDRRVQPSIAGQRPIVKVHRPKARPRQDQSRDQVQIRN